jgi:diguanylate cyclase (GGDEF)-like protein/PAS domain S-box-containing protein
MVADVAVGGFTVLGADTLTRRLVTGARHPAGPHHTEVIPAAGFGVLGEAMTTAGEPPFETVTMEIPVGDDPRWFEITITPVVTSGKCRQLVVMGAEHTTDHEIEKRHRRERRRLEVMVEHAPGAVLLVDSAGRIVSAAGALGHVTHTIEELRGRSLFELVHPEALARAATIFDHALGLPGEPLRFESLGLGGSNGYRWYDATVTNRLHDDDVAALVMNARDITDRVEAEHRIERDTDVDGVTGLPNRRALLARLAPSSPVEDATGSVGAGAPVGPDGPVGIVLVDLDEFALVNEVFGHDIGDAVLQEVASRLVETCDGSALVARVGGDEFAVLVPLQDDPGRADETAEAIERALGAPIETPTGQVTTRASIGVADSETDVPGDALLRAAELALARAKASGRNRIAHFNTEMQLTAEKRLAEITELQKAIHEGRLRLAYQPIVRLDGALVGVEALLRWDHDGELLSPARFLDLAEDTGLILPMGSWVIDRACLDFSELRNAAPLLRWVSVNLSSSQLLDERLPAVIERALSDHGLASDSLAIEVDDRTLRDSPAARAMLSRLGEVRAMVSFAEIGSGWEVLASLQETGAHVVKLGRHVVSELDASATNRTLAAAVIELARADGIEVIAEGVETRAQLTILSELGCPLAQGYLYSPPLDLATFVTVSRSQRSV